MRGFSKEKSFSVAAPEPDAVEFAWSPDGRGIAVLSFLMRRVSYFDVASGKLAAQVDNLAGAARSVAFVKNGDAVIPPKADMAGGFALWSVRSGEVRTVAGPFGAAKDPAQNLLFAFSVDKLGDRLAGLHYAPLGQGLTIGVAVYDLTKGQLSADHPLPSSALSISPDGSLIAVSARDGVEVVSADTGASVARITPGAIEVQSLGWSADGRCIATGTFGQGYGRNPTTGKLGRLREDRVLQLWGVEAKSRIAESLTDLGGGVESLDFSGDGRWLATTSADGVCRLWDARTLAAGPTVASGLQPGSAVVRFSPDSLRLAILKTVAAEISTFLLQG